MTTTKLIEKFRQVYADAVPSNLSDQTRDRIRSLQWHGERVPLQEAAEVYGMIEEPGYNNFEPHMLADFEKTFSGSGIEVTPAREGSVAVYFHIPDKPTLLQAVESFITKHWDADEMDMVTEFTCLQAGETELEGKALRVWWD